MCEDIESIVKECLGRDYLEDKVETTYGWSSKTNSDIYLGPRFLISFNYPTTVDEIDYISQFIGDADAGTVRKFYRATNGMRILGDRFVVPGVRFYTSEMKGQDFFNVPICLKVTSGLEYPVHAPLSGAVIGVSSASCDKSRAQLLDILSGEGEIVCGRFNENSLVTSVFTNFEDWLSTRIAMAKQDFQEYANSRA